jgi:uncharacterized metal-binding protein YceD (DUF177 family)
MSGRRDYDIAFVGLKPGTTEFDFELGTTFFEQDKTTYFNDIQSKVNLKLEKNSGFMQLKFEVGGTADILCNRCGNPLKIDLWDDFEMLVKLVDNPDEMNENNEDPDVFFISRTESHLNIKDWLFEFTILSIPQYPVCGEDEKGNSKCNQEVIQMLEKLTENEEKDTNTIWKGLDKFKDN